MYDVIIVGAGASGLLCALECARAGLHTLVLEKSQQPGRKILVSGNGRCNLTNRYVSAAGYRADPTLIEAALKHFSFEDCLRYFKDLGVLLTEEAQGRIFPASGKSSAVVEALKLALREEEVEIKCGVEITQIRAAAAQFILTSKEKDMWHARKVVLACGSCAYPQVTGTTRGYELAQALGHHLVQPLPALSGLCLKERAFTRLSGIKCQVRTTIVSNPQLQAEGELIFTNYGINGPAALNISAAVSRALSQGPVPITINFFPQLKNREVFWQERLKHFGFRKPKDFFAGLLQEGIINLLLDFRGVKKNTPMAEQSGTPLFETLSAWPATVTALRPWQEAMAATGGVKTSEINYNTFESRICPGLYLTGELLDVDGKSGGYNLHFAWASAFTAVQAIKEK